MSKRDQTKLFSTTTRRQFLETSAALGASALGVGALGIGQLLPSVDSSAIKLQTFSDLWQTPEIRTSLCSLFQDFAMAPVGKLLVQHSNTLHTRRELTRQYVTGRIDGLIGSPSKKQFPGLSIFGQLPFTLGANQTSAWLHSVEGREAWRRYFEKRDCEAIYLGSLDVAYGQVGRFGSLESTDFSKLRIACHPRSAGWLRAAGLNPVCVGSNAQMKEFFENGKIDLTAALPHSMNLELGMVSGNSTYFINETNQINKIVAIALRRQKWDSLGVETRNSILTLSNKHACALNESGGANDRRVLEEIRQLAPVEAYRYPLAFENVLRQQTHQAIKKIATREPSAAALCLAYQDRLLGSNNLT